jgi:hypothetical protein
MDKERVIKKLLLNIAEFNMSVTEALILAYGAGYDERKKDYNQSQEKVVIQEDVHHKNPVRYDSMSDARKAMGMSKTGMISAIKNNLLTRKGYYFRYENDNKETVSEDKTQSDNPGVPAIE